MALPDTTPLPGLPAILAATSSWPSCAAIPGAVSEVNPLHVFFAGKKVAAQILVGGDPPVT